VNAGIMQRGRPVPETTCASLWLTPAKIATVQDPPTTPRGVRSHFKALLAGVNGTRDRYARRVASRGGECWEFNYTLLAKDFSGAVKPEALCAAIQKYSGPESQEKLALESVSSSDPETTLALPFPEAITAEVYEIPERALPLAQARFRVLESVRGETWRKWEGQSIHGILLRTKRNFVEALARDAKLAPRGQVLADWNSINADLAHGTGKRGARLEPSAGTILTWHTWYLNGKQKGTRKFSAGITALQDPPPPNAGKSIFGEAPRTLDFYDEAAIAAELERLTPAGKRLAELMLIEKRSVPVTQEILLHERVELGLPETLSPTTVNRFYKSFPKPLLLWTRGRAKDFHDSCAPYVCRDFASSQVMQWWVLDHGQDDFFVRNDYIEALDRLTFPELPRDAKLRMNLTAVEELRSRFILGYNFCVNGDSAGICSSLRMALLRTGRAPQFGLIDRGEDFKKVGENKPELPQEAQGAFRRLIEAAWGESGRIIFSIGEHPQSKPIERWFGTKRARFDSQVDSYCGRRPADRPDHCAELLKQHEQFLLGKREESPLPRASEAIKATVWWIETWYNRQHRHTGQSMGRRTPEEIFRRGYPDSERQEALAKLDRGALDAFLRHRERRKVFNGGCIKMFGQEFEPADAQSLGRLFACVGREVLIAADPALIGDAVAFDPQTGERLGALISKKLLAWGADQNTIRAAMRHQRRAAKSCRTYIEHLSRTYHAPEGEFGFLGEEYLRATGTDGIRALPPGRPLNLAGAPPAESAPVITSDFVNQHGDFGDVKVEEG
jgi:hypothetical protein